MDPQLPDTAICLQCGYSLRGLTDTRCPECGRTFVPADRSTFGPWRLAGPPSKWLSCGVIIVTAVQLLSSTTTGDLSLLWGCATLLLFLVAGIDYLIRVATVVSLGASSAGAVARPIGNRRRWIAAPLCLLLIGSAMMCEWPTILRFRLSKPAFDRVAQAVLAGRQTNMGTQRIGLYHVESIAVDPGGRVEFVVGHQYIDDVFFVHDPRGAPSWCIVCVAPGWYLMSS